MIEHTISVIVNENVDKIMNFILNNMDDYVNTGKIKSIRKVETHEILDISSTKSPLLITDASKAYNSLTFWSIHL